MSFFTAMVKFVCPCGQYFTRKEHAEKHLHLKNKCTAWSTNLSIDCFERITDKMLRHRAEVSSAYAVNTACMAVPTSNDVDLIPFASTEEFDYILAHAAEFLPIIFEEDDIDDPIGARFARTVWFNSRHCRLHNIFMISKQSQAVRIFHHDVHGYPGLKDIDFASAVDVMIDTTHKYLTALCDEIDPLTRVKVVIQVCQVRCDEDDAQTRMVAKRRAHGTPNIAYRQKRVKYVDSGVKVHLTVVRDDINQDSLQVYTRPTLERRECDGTLSQLIDSSGNGIAVVLMNDPFKIEKTTICKRLILGARR